jgi:hypothetical protein
MYKLIETLNDLIPPGQINSIVIMVKLLFKEHERTNKRLLAYRLDFGIELNIR